MGGNTRKNHLWLLWCNPEDNTICKNETDWKNGRGLNECKAKLVNNANTQLTPTTKFHLCATNLALSCNKLNREHSNVQITLSTESCIHWVPHTSPKIIRFDLSPSKPTSPRYPAAMRACNVIWDRWPTKGALDSGATSHLFPISYEGTNHQTTKLGNYILVQCANDTTITSVATNRLNLQSLPVAARECHKFDHMPTPLISVKTFCENNLDVLFKRDTVTVTVTNADGNTVLEGALDPTTDLYMVSLDDASDTVPPQGGVFRSLRQW